MRSGYETQATNCETGRPTQSNRRQQGTEAGRKWQDGGREPLPVLDWKPCGVGERL